MVSSLFLNSLSLSLPSSLFFFHSAAPCRNLGVRELLLEARPRGAPKPDARRRRVELEALLLVADGSGARARVRSRSQRGVARDSGSGVRDCSDRVRKDPRWGRRSSKSSTSSRRLRRGRVHCAAKKVETFFFWCEAHLTTSGVFSLISSSLSFSPLSLKEEAL